MRITVAHISTRYEGLAWGVAGLSLFLILWATLMPSAQKDEILSPFTPFFRADKLGHLYGFGLLCCAMVCTGRIGWAVAVLVGVGLGALTETLQLLVPGRQALFTDVLVDAAGAALGVAAPYAWHRWRVTRLCAPEVGGLRAEERQRRER